MIGVIIWAILIAFIAVAACPGFVTAFLASAAIVGVIYVAALFVISKIKEFRTAKETFPRIRSRDIDAEIEEWEKKHNRIHPCKKYR